MHTARILLTDDHALVLEGLRQLLESEFTVVGTGESGQALLEMAPRLSPDVVLLDVSMPGLNGFETAQRLKQLLPSVKIVFVTMMTEPVYISEAFRSGAHGYVLKQCAAAELVTAIRTVLMGRRYVSPEVAPEVREVVEHEWMRPEGFTNRLTDRQIEVLRLLARGYAAKEIARTLSVSLKTVEFHKANITKKLGLKTASDLTKYAIAHGLTSVYDLRADMPPPAASDHPDTRT
ncbi:MAG TPA: response regulator transcription factor [Nitrospiraceae bacterium]|jgi:DNA-binding NarL/FixJ family response regulator|nr:response regulator transcription factor [Nitrospiraceae bacterium]